VGATICQQNSGTVNLTVNPLPLARTVVGSTITTYQAARNGTTVELQNSETGVSYQLVNTSVMPNAFVGAAQMGNGGTLSFATGPLDTSTGTNRTTTTFAVLGTSTLAPTNCAQQVGTASVTYSGPLPVELTEFTAVASRGDAVLAWRTASEKNNNHFAVERSVDGREFTAVGQVAGQGTSTQPKAYTFRDAGAAGRAKQLYYRLRQVDHDGTESTSPVRVVEFAKDEAAMLLYPNPASTAVTCSLAQLPAGTYQVKVLSLTGQTLSSTQITNDQPRTLDVTNLPAGVYTVHVSNGTLNLTQRLVKLQ
jgi:hypothetical protein